jgi:chromatin remodeling complex protein RSC6
MAKKGSAITRKIELDEDVREFFNNKKSISRGDALKEIWEYIRENDLKVEKKASNPSTKRGAEIMLDEELQFIFNTNKKKIRSTEIMGLMKEIFAE